MLVSNSQQSENCNETFERGAKFYCWKNMLLCVDAKFLSPPFSPKRSTFFFLISFTRNHLASVLILECTFCRRELNNSWKFSSFTFIRRLHSSVSILESYLFLHSPFFFCSHNIHFLFLVDLYRLRMIVFWWNYSSPFCSFILMYRSEFFFGFILQYFPRPLLNVDPHGLVPAVPTGYFLFSRPL